MELRNLRHFLALAETLNYHVAAERLYLTQSALTRSIAALERERRGLHRGLDPPLSGEYDIALARLSADRQAVTRVPVFTEPALVHLWKGHPLTSAAAVDVTEILDDPWVTPDVESDYWVCGDQRDHAALIGCHARSPVEMCSAIAYQHTVVT